MLKDLNSLTFLEVLDLSSNLIKKIKNVNTGPIKDSIRILKLASNKIGKMTGVDEMLNLVKLDLSKSPLTQARTRSGTSIPT